MPVQYEINQQAKILEPGSEVAFMPLRKYLHKYK
jgi:hypothetical protein